MSICEQRWGQKEPFCKGLRLELKSIPTTVRALTTGSAVIDVIAHIDHGDIEQMSLSNATTSYLWLEQGRKVDAHSIATHVGGGAINVAAAWQRLGLAVAPLVKIGRDLNGEEILQSLRQQGLRTDLVRYSETLGSGVSVLISAHDRNAAIFTYRGANTRLRPSDFNARDFADIDLVFISNLSNESADCYPEIINLAKQAGSKVAVNPGIRQITTRGTKFASSLRGVDLLTMNKTEAEAAMTFVADGDKPRIALKPPEAADNQARLWRGGLRRESMRMSLAEFMAHVRARGADMVCITDGTDGSYLATSAGLYFCPSQKVEVKGTAGAGDAFAATLSYSLFSGIEPKQALAMAGINSAAVVTQLDTQSGLLTKSDLLDRLAAQAGATAVVYQPWS